MNEGTAPDIPLDVATLSTMKAFCSYNRLKKLAMRHLALTYTDEEIRDIREQFILMDADGTGTISIDELVDAIEKAVPIFGMVSGSRSMGREEALEIMQGLDYNKDGELDYIEFTTAALRIKQRQKR